MDLEDSKIWLDYNSRGVKATRYKLNSLVYSNHGILSMVSFELDGYGLSIYPVPSGGALLDSLDGYMLAFGCEVVSEGSKHRGGGNFDIKECLDRVMPLLGFNYRLPLEYTQWEEYEGRWIKSIAGGGAVSMQSQHKELPNKNIFKLVSAYEKISKKMDKRSKKALAIRSRLKEAGELERVSRRYSFLSYYSVIEIISDDMASNKSCPSGSSIAIDIAEHALSTKGSQRTKLYFILNALENDFDVGRCIGVADVRNNIAHGEQVVKYEDFDLCKKIAFLGFGGICITRSSEQCIGGFKLLRAI